MRDSTEMGGRWKLSRLLTGLLLASLTGCSEKPEPGPMPRVPTLSRTEQTAYSVRARGFVDFSITPEDEDPATLRFEWKASAGTLASPVDFLAESEVAWTGPDCMPAATPVTVEVKITNSRGGSTEHPFSVFVTRCRAGAPRTWPPCRR